MPAIDTVVGIERFPTVRGYSLECDICKVIYNGGNGSDSAVPYRPRGYRAHEEPLLIKHALQLGWTGVEQHLDRRHNPFRVGLPKPIQTDRCPVCTQTHLISQERIT